MIIPHFNTYKLKTYTKVFMICVNLQKPNYFHRHYGVLSTPHKNTTTASSILKTILTTNLQTFIHKRFIGGKPPITHVKKVWDLTPNKKYPPLTRQALFPPDPYMQPQTPIVDRHKTSKLNGFLIFITPKNVEKVFHVYKIYFQPYINT